jgi:BirA family transcriptional regulator, biotin operon repressor / biotin---[acetyl-CoA-carboxylase] ligase
MTELPPGCRLVFHESIGSTNDEAKRLARDGATEGTFVWALEQSAGRGRRGRAWVSPRGNLYTSLILRPECAPGRAAQLGFVAALAVGGALRALLPRFGGVSYKWPNDVLVEGRKIAGILLESEMVSFDRLSFLVVGVGVNLTASPPGKEFPATSVLEAGLGTLVPELMLEEFANHFQSWESRWREQGFAPVRAAWLAAAATTRGQPVRVRLEKMSLHGRFLDIDEKGALLLDAAGECRHISAGEIFPANHC